MSSRNGLQVLVAACVALAGCDTSAPEAPRAAHIAFIYDGYGLFVVPRAGGEQKLVSLAANEVTAYDWTPDGDGLVYAFDREVHYVRYDGTADRLLIGSRSALIDDLAVAPDGHAIAFAQAGHLYLLPTGAPAAVPLTSGAAGRYIFTVSWAPSSDRIAISRQDDATLRTEVWVVPTGGGGTVKVSNTYAMLRARWSPAGDRILFDTEGAVFTMTSSGTDIGQITPPRQCPPEGFCGLDQWSHAQWSPDGQRIITLGRPNTETEYWQYVITVATGAVQRLPYAGFDARFSPDGSEFVYTAVDPPGGPGVVAIGTASGVQPVGLSGYGASRARWQPQPGVSVTARITHR